MFVEGLPSDGWSLNCISLSILHCSNGPMIALKAAAAWH